MLANEAQLIVKKIDQVENQVAREKRKNKYSNLLIQLEKCKSRIDIFIEFKYVLGKNIEDISFDNINKIIKEIKEAIINDNISEREGAYLNSTLDGIETQLKNQWKNYHRDKTVGLIQTLTNIEPFFSDPTEIKSIILNLKKFDSTWPINRNKYDTFEGYISKGKEKINKLELTDDIRKFINRITANTATIEDLTPSILKWIQDNKYENKIKLRFR